MATPEKPASPDRRDDAWSDTHVVQVRSDETTVWVTLARPQQRNPLDWDTVRRLDTEVARIEAMPQARVVVLRGAGGNFSAGGDLKGYMQLYREPARFRQFLEDFHHLLDRIETSSKIYVACVEGYCVAGGLELLLACDLVIASHSARIGDGHLNFGQLPGAGGSQRLTRTIGPMQARYLMLTGELVDGAQAERLGLVSKCIADDELDAFLQQLLQRLGRASPLGLSGMKHLANHGLSMPIEQALRMEMDFVADYATSSSDAMEGLLAFDEKRAPRFTGT